jgi:hypothetical protein
MAVAVVAVPAVAMATVYTPSSTDLGDLDHHMLYTWKISDPALAGKTISSATLTFTNMYNWDNNANKLFLHLLNTANNGACGTTLQGCVAQFTDDPTGSTTVTLRDDFTNNYDPPGSAPAYHSDPNWPVPGIGSAGHEDTFLTSHSFAGIGANPSSAPGESIPFAPGTPPVGWSYKLGGMSGSNQLYTYTFVFDTTQTGLLQSYITAGGDFAIGLDPDCHFFNDGVSLTVLTSSTTTAVPEPASLALLGSGLLAVARRYRRRTQA